MGDRGIPKTWRHMNGYGSHTYLWINAAGEKHWVKYHFHSDQGVESLTGEEAAHGSPARTPTSTAATCYDAIEAGDFPSWTLSVQVMPYEDAKTYRFNPFDLTKVWPHSDYPLIKVGTMTLNRNPDNFFAQIEQAAFEPQRGRAGHRVQPRQDAARPGVRLLRHAPLPHRPELPASCRSTGPRVGASTPTRRTARWPTSTAVTSRSTRRTATAAATPTYVGEVEDGWEADGAMVRAGLHAARRTTTTSARPARWSARSGTTRSARRSSTTVAGHLLGGVEGAVLERAFEYWKSVDADTGKQIEEAVRAGSRREGPGARPHRPRGRHLRTASTGRACRLLRHRMRGCDLGSLLGSESSVQARGGTNGARRLSGDARKSRARLADARDSQASCTTSATSSRVSSPIREVRSSTDRWPSKCGVVKYGVAGSATIASFSPSSATQITTTSS